MRRLQALIAVCVALLALAPAAAAHHLFVTPKGGGNGNVGWVGGGPVPGQGAALIPSPIGMLPPAHGAGLVTACLKLMENATPVKFVAPPIPPFVDEPDFDCMHG